MTAQTVLPHVTATLNAITVLLLMVGFVLIRRRDKLAHRVVMTSAVGVSALFLICYLIYHFSAPVFVFPGQGIVRPIYYTLLISHVLLSMAVVPMIAMTVWRAAHGRFDRHMRLARWTLPVWLYVSVTGLVVYAMLYHVYAVA